MTTFSPTRRKALGLALLGAAIPAMGRAQPARGPVRLVVPYAPGGTNDVTARLLSARLSEGLGATCVIENRSGASGAIGAQEVSRSAPDGLTLLYSNEVHPILKLVQRGVPFDALTDFTPVIRTVSIPYVLIGGARAERPTDPVALLADVKRAPSRYTFACSSLGSVGHLGAAALGQKLGVEVTTVIYRGTGPAVNDVISGAVPLMFAPVGAVLPLIQGGQLRAYAVTAPKRISSMPDTPAMPEIGQPDMLFEGWCGMWGPRGLPEERVSAIHAAALRALRDAEVVARLAAIGCAPIEESTADFAKLLIAEQARGAAIIKAAGITPE
ncbi:tripartite tricarboxylate transporter substrate binding protein [Roseomonas sp. SSH11]|uniref:Tripartite tricarboxylate transporter substrate binding protein n=1 Tax=Pararoseomonas baculiformis TaxID=2820812 RepID=A0ABS4AJJ6_9PROT|nr:tripartite tricarboxylate transporter substrate binding protein [Pararoseomonas baculiformis]MBP0447212.1 tripartite tricarboxylate transporter substrate binding protein [Pararoseomonas baculiformis]